MAVVFTAPTVINPITLLFVIEDDVVTLCIVLAMYALSPLEKLAAGANAFNNSTTEPDPEPVMSRPFVSRLR